MSLLNKSQLCNQSWHCLENWNCFRVWVFGLGRQSETVHVRLTTDQCTDDVFKTLVMMSGLADNCCLNAQSSQYWIRGNTATLWSIWTLRNQVDSATWPETRASSSHSSLWPFPSQITSGGRDKKLTGPGWLFSCYHWPPSSLANSMHNGNFCNHLIKFCTLMIAFALVKLGKINPNKSN